MAYTKPSQSGYNSSPPPDDGTTSEANKLKWATIKDKLADPNKVFITAVNDATETAFNELASTATDKGASTVGVQDASGYFSDANMELVIAELRERTFLLDGQGVLCPYKGLYIANNATNPNYQVDIDAAGIIVTAPTGRRYSASSVNLTVDLTASGANGLDTGSEANSTWYHLWVIYNGSTVAGLMSTSATAPTMPSGYTYKGYVGAIYNNSSGDLVKTRQRNHVVSCTSQANLSAGTSTTNASVTVSIPTTANEVLVTLEDNPNASSFSNFTVSPINDNNHRLLFRGAATGATAGDYKATAWVPIYEDQTIYYAIITGDGLNISTIGWKY